jgi:hypothetical protein
VTDAPKNSGTYELITPLNALKTRIGGGPGVDRQMAKRASAAVASLQGDFLQRVSTATGEITAQIALAKRSDGDGEECAAEIFRISSDLRTQGAAFDYPLISDICASLCSYIEIFKMPAGAAGEVVRAHTDALQLVLDNAIQGDGGYEGLDLIESLNKLANRSRR